MTTSIHPRRRTATHEAGHAVLAVHQGFTVSLVQVKSELNGAILGKTETDATRLDLPVGRLEDAIIVALAGNLAEEILLGGVERVPGIRAEREHDETILQWHLSRLCPWDSPGARARCEEQTRILVEQNRDAIAALASRLLDLGAISDYTTSL
jgi:hypothetical protein